MDMADVIEYDPTVWVDEEDGDGPKLCAENLNKIEDGISAITERANTLLETLSALDTKITALENRADELGEQIGTDRIADDAVTTAKIADDAVSSDKLAQSVRDSMSRLDGIRLGYTSNGRINLGLKAGELSMVIYADKSGIGLFDSDKNTTIWHS